MNAKRFLSLILVLCMIFVLASCGGRTENDTTTEAVSSETVVSDETTITDMIGREVTVTPGSYKKVVCIGAGALRMYSYIGDVTLLCGVEDIDNMTAEDRPMMFDTSARPYVLAYGEIFDKLPSCGVGGPNAQTAEAEKILACEPDIIISEYEDVEKEDALQEQTGVPVITLKSGPAGVFADDFRDSLRLLGKIFSADKKAETLISFIEKETAEISSRTAGIADDDKPSVYICGLGNWGTTNHLVTSGQYAAFKVANVKNAVSGVGIEGVCEIEEEKLVSMFDDIDIMIIDSAAIKNIKPALAEEPEFFEDCNAWTNKQVYLEMAFNAYYTNYEIALANAWFIAKTVYPEKFEDIDMTAKLNEITNVFLGKELAEDIFSCPASFGGYQQVDISDFFD